MEQAPAERGRERDAAWAVAGLATPERPEIAAPVSLEEMPIPRPAAAEGR